MVPDQNIDDEDDEEQMEMKEEGQEEEEAAAEGDKEKKEDGREGPSEPTVKTHAVDDEYKKADGEANYYRYGCLPSQASPSASLDRPALSRPAVGPLSTEREESSVAYSRIDIPLSLYLVTVKAALSQAES